MASCFLSTTTPALVILILGLYLSTLSHSVIITMKKGNIDIAKNSNYNFKLDISQTKSQINPLNISLYH